MSSVLLLVLLACCCVIYADEEIIARPHYVILNSEPLNIEAELAARTNGNNRLRAGTRSPLTPSEMRAIYNIPNSTTSGLGKTIAIVDAYGSSTAEADLAVFSAQFNLPPCTTANGCFKKVDQTGGTRYPPDDKGWATEVALDVQTVHGIAPYAKILLVVANTASLTNLFTAVNYAKLHADYVSMSFGAAEGSYVTNYDSLYFSTTPTVSFFASTGDNGAAAGVSFPSTSPHVVAVGGTSIFVNSDFSLSVEQGWTGSGGGCSAFFTAPAVQSSLAGYTALNCAGKRAVPDVGMDADPNSGAYVYNSQNCTTVPNCYTAVGGTSLAAPLTAARAAVYGGVSDVSFVYGNGISYRDITVGNNGFQCLTGIDLVTGRGAWIGTTKSADVSSLGAAGALPSLVAGAVVAALLL